MSTLCKYGIAINYWNYVNLQPVLVLHILTDRYKNKYKKWRLEINETNADKYITCIYSILTAKIKNEKTPLCQETDGQTR